MNYTHAGVTHLPTNSSPIKKQTKINPSWSPYLKAELDIKASGGQNLTPSCSIASTCFTCRVLCGWSWGGAFRLTAQSAATPLTHVLIQRPPMSVLLLSYRIALGSTASPREPQSTTGPGVRKPLS